MKPSFYPVTTTSTGKLYMMPKPSSEFLNADLRYYRSDGINVVVSMLEKTEALELGLQVEAASCARHQLQFIQLETPDFGLPEDAPFATLVNFVVMKLAQGQSVAVHCRAGIGRSGMLIACVLIDLGLTPEAAIKQVTESRGQTVPETDEQIAFIYKYASGL
ncbi:MAG: protein-tyrosine phosphatase family protein [Alphaproteobacteria bacterium]